MKIAVFAGAALAVAFAVAPAAEAQASCEDIKRLLTEADADFTAIYGDRIRDDRYDASFHLPNASSCVVDYEWDSVYTCYWRFPSESAAARFIDAQLETFRACLDPADWSEDMLDPALQESDWRLIRGASFVGGEDFEGLVFTARADVGEENGSEVYEVEFDLTYLVVF
jgi:hypothetical protein